MKLPNGFGSVYKLSGKRRNPWVARKTSGWKDNGQPVYKFIGYYPTRKDALTALSDYNEDPWNINHITFAEVYDKWSEEYFDKIDQRNQKSYKRAFDRCGTVHNIPLVDIKLDQMQSIVDRSGLNKPTLKKIKSLTNHLYDYGVKHEIVTKEKKDVMSYLDLSKAGNPNQIERIPFTKDEIEILWKNESDIPLFLIYTGLRIGEFYDLKWEHVHLQEKYFDVVKSKTTAGIRTVPIHNKLIPILERHKGSEYVFTNMSGGHFTDHVFRNVYWNRIMES